MRLDSIKNTTSTTRVARARLLRIFLAAAGLVIVVPGAAADPRFHGGRVYVAWDVCTGQRYRPRQITFACGDGGLYATNIRYHTYGGKTATASVLLHSHSCIPDCAESAFHAFPATIVLKDIVRCAGTLFYSRARWHFINGAPYGGLATGTANIEPFGEEGEPICGPVLG